ncbi:hypothetical protein Ae201684P_011855 [Aphanomyces euteiches]|uniref:RRM domain-containing protein n=1 Tax=Aphanomyces euteiches TaxID=100861 RepID=A0A6G0WU66_9STRA|nr:hypothetical protein Ae201684_011598 [Aphanomyces euteiches]KAH9097129.1 hypothetical protein Ae201684P_011855 [Aphanomyces euteiches]
MGRRSNSSPSTSRSRSRERRDSRDSRRGDRRDDRYRSRSRGRDSHDDRPIPQSLLVRGIPNSVTIDVLREKFSRRRGDIRDVYVPKDHATGEPRGFAFIEFKDIREARDVKNSMDRTKLDGAEISVIFAQQRRKTPDQMRRQELETRGSSRKSQRHQRRSRSPSRSCSPSEKHLRNRNRSRSRSDSPVRRYRSGD